MKKTLFLLLSLLSFSLLNAQCESTLFFSEYMEGSSFNKAIEVYNPTLDTIDLSDYEIHLFANGMSTAFQTFQTKGLLSPGEVYVITHSSAYGPTQAIADTTLSTIMAYNGDDAILLLNTVSNDSVDIFGKIGQDPGSGWTVGAGATNNYTLVRSNTVIKGEKDWAIGINQWLVFPIDNIDSLGGHSSPQGAASITTFSDESICEGDSLLIFGNWEKTAGVYTDSNSSNLGCDSISIQELIVNPVYSDTLTVISICDKDSISIFGSFERTAGFYVDVNISIFGCDSNTVQELIVNPTYRDTLSILTTCDNVPVLIFGSFENTTGFYVDSNTTSLGCDSVTVQELVVNSYDRDTLNAITICSNDSVSIFGIYESMAGFYTDSGSNILGCDSITVQQLLVNIIDKDTLNGLSICYGDSISVFGNYEKLAGWYVDSNTNTLGCDSLTHVNLIVKLPATSTVRDTICNGDSIFISGEWRENTQMFNDTLVGASANTCDSVVTHYVVVNFVTPVLVIGGDSVVCGNDTLRINTSATYESYLWNNGDTTNGLKIAGGDLGVGFFDYWLTVVDGVNGCSVTDSITVEVENCVGLEKIFGSDFEIYPNPATSNLIIKMGDDFSENIVIEIINSLGAYVYRETLGETTKDLRLDVSNYTRGYYLVRMISNKKTITKKLIIK